MVLAKFRQHYPQGSLVGELVDIDRGTYIVKVSIEVENVVLATGLAAADRVETAEDAARERAIAALVLDRHQPVVRENPVVLADSDAQINPPQTTPQPTQLVSTLEESIPKAHNGNANNNAESIDSEPKELSPIDSPSYSGINSEFANYPEETPVRPSVSPTQVSAPALSQPIFAPETKSESQPQVGTSNSAGNLFEGTLDSLDSIVEENSPVVENEAAVRQNSNSAIATESTEAINFDFNEVKQKTDLEIRRLGWTKEDGREFLKSRYGKRSRLHLTDRQLLEFLHYLESQPNPN